MLDCCLEDKDTIRARMQMQRAQMHDEERARLSAKIVDAVSGLSPFQHADVLCSFVSMPEEVQVEALTAFAHDRGIPVMLPAYDKNAKRYRLREWVHMSPLAVGKWNIPEPVGPDYHEPYGRICVLVPGLAFDLQGNRIGFGRGYYDRILQDLRKPRNNDVVAIGVAFAFQVLDALPQGIHDEKVDFVVSDAKWKNTNT